MEIKIEKGIPLPPCVLRRMKWQALFNSMEPGDSFLVPDKEMVTKAIGSARMFKTIYKKTQEGYRVWLLEKKRKETQNANSP